MLCCMPGVAGWCFYVSCLLGRGRLNRAEMATSLVRKTAQSKQVQFERLHDAGLVANYWVLKT